MVLKVLFWPVVFVVALVGVCLFALFDYLGVVFGLWFKFDLIGLLFGCGLLDWCCVFIGVLSWIMLLVRFDLLVWILGFIVVWLAVVLFGWLPVCLVWLVMLIVYGLFDYVCCNLFYCSIDYFVFRGGWCLMVVVVFWLRFMLLCLVCLGLRFGYLLLFMIWDVCLCSKFD